jgi:hypothetical protein
LDKFQRDDCGTLRPEIESPPAGITGFAVTIQEKNLFFILLRGGETARIPCYALRLVPPLSDITP